MNTVTLLLEDGRRIFTTEERVESWLQTRKNLHKEGDYLIEESEETETIYDEKVIADIVKLLEEYTPVSRVIRTLLNHYVDTAYYNYPENGMWEEKLKALPNRTSGMNVFPEYVSYKRVKKITKARIIK